jgi:hypothetical protein
MESNGKDNDYIHFCFFVVIQFESSLKQRSDASNWGKLTVVQECFS